MTWRGAFKIMSVEMEFAEDTKPLEDRWDSSGEEGWMHPTSWRWSSSWWEQQMRKRRWIRRRRTQIEITGCLIHAEMCCRDITWCGGRISSTQRKQKRARCLWGAWGVWGSLRGLRRMEKREQSAMSGRCFPSQRRSSTGGRGSPNLRWTRTFFMLAQRLEDQMWRKREEKEKCFLMR